MRPNTIVHIVLGKANPERSNGVNKVVFELAMSQHAAGENVAIWGITKTPVVNFPERSFVTRLFKDSKSKFVLSKALKKAIKEADNQTIFHLHGGFLPQMFSVARRITAVGKQYIYTPHGAYNLQAMKRSAIKKQMFIQGFEKYVVHHAKYVHVIGKSEIDGTQSTFGKDVPIRLIPNGHRSSEIPSTRREPSDRIRLGFMGRIDMTTKGLDILLDGFSRFIDDGNSGELHIAGDGKDTEELHELIQAFKLEKYVVVHGAVFGEAKAKFFQQLDYFCLTSRNEGLPGVVLEALDFGLPCIVSKETNMGDAIESYSAGFVLEENTSRSLGKCLNQLLETEQQTSYENQSINARYLVRSEYDWSVISKQLIRAFYAV